MSVPVRLASCLLLLGLGCTSAPEPGASDPRAACVELEELRGRNKALVEANEQLQVEISVLKGRIKELESRERRLAKTLRKREFELEQQELQIRDLADLRDQRDAVRARVEALQERIAELRLRLEAASGTSGP